MPENSGPATVGHAARERLLALGARSLGDDELLAVLMSGHRRQPGAIESARSLLAQFDGVGGLFSAPRTVLLAASGIGPGRWCTLQAALELTRRSVAEDLRHRNALDCPEAVARFLALSLQHCRHEVFTVLFLDNRNRLLAAEEMFRGTLTQTAVYPREVARAALERNAAAVILAHNHPSGVAEPSQADRLLTQALKQALSCLDIPVLDHVIVAGGRRFSFAENGLL